MTTSTSAFDLMLPKSSADVKRLVQAYSDHCLCNAHHQAALSRPCLTVLILPLLPDALSGCVHS